MIPVLGELLLYLSLIICIVAVAFAFASSISIRVIGGLSILSTVACVASMVCLIYGFYGSDLSLRIVFENSHNKMPTIYKISAAWGNHEGSMLLWVINLLAINSAFYCLSKVQSNLKKVTITVQNLVAIAFLLFVIFASSPFERILPPPLEGKGFNAILQDYAIAIHPPLLYIGYVGFSITYSFAIAAIICRVKPAYWASHAKQWLMIAWGFLTAGICFGSSWAYRELGWGGFWFWDPVENASLIPWLAATALIHSMILTKKNGLLANISYFLAISVFALSMLGTFVVRSGLLTSVHSFAVDPSRGFALLGILALLTGGGLLALILAKIQMVRLENQRHKYIAGGVFLTILLCTVVLIGTFYPLCYQAFYMQAISVSENYYNTITPQIVAAMLLFITLSTSRIGVTIASTIAIFTITWAFFKFTGYEIDYVTTFIICFSAYVLMETLAKALSKLTLSASYLAHIGVALILISIAFNSIFKKEAIMEVNVKEPVTLGEFKIAVSKISVNKTANYISQDVELEVVRLASPSRILKATASQRYYPIEKQQTVEPAIINKPTYDLYIVLTELKPDGNAILRVYFRPMINFLYFGGYLIIAAAIYWFIRRYFLYFIYSAKAL